MDKIVTEYGTFYASYNEKFEIIKTAEENYKDWIANKDKIDISNTVKSNEELTVENEYLTKCIAELTELLLV